jgi:hypothetical protein
MTIQVDLKPELEARLLAEAEAQGLPIETVAERFLERALEQPGPGGNLTIEEFDSMLEALAKGSEKLPNLPTDSFTRESFYQDDRF